MLFRTPSEWVSISKPNTSRSSHRGKLLVLHYMVAFLFVVVVDFAHCTVLIFSYITNRNEAIQYESLFFPMNVIELKNHNDNQLNAPKCMKKKNKNKTYEENQISCVYDVSMREY